MLDRRVLEGGYGKVLIVEKENKKLAIKVLKSKSTNQIEADILKKLQSHPNIIQFYNFYFENDFLHIVTEFFDAENLLSYVQRNIIVGEEMTKMIFRQMCHGVCHMHDRNILHRDLKLENCLINSHNHIKWIDFGLSIETSADNTLTTISGSKSYIAPEVWEKNCIGFSSDIWSLVVCLFGMIFGFFPYEVSNNDDWRYKLAGHSCKKVDTILKLYDKKSIHSEDVKNLIEYGLEVQPLKRFDVYNLLNHSWLDIL